MSNKIVAMPYYSKAAWHQLQRIPESGIQKSYAEYLLTLEAAEREVAAKGLTAKRIPIDTDAMFNFCCANGYTVGAKGGAAYVAQQVNGGAK